MSMTVEESKERLKKLLKRRENYFLLSDFKKNAFRSEFEQVQKEIITLKVILNLYHDELDILGIWVDYGTEESKIHYKILENAEMKKEIQCLSKRYYFTEQKSEYIYIVLKGIDEISDEWLKGKIFMHQMKREGLIQCPWPTTLNEKEVK